MLVSSATSAGKLHLPQVQFKPEVYALRRKKFVQQLKDNSLVILPNKSHAMRTYDTEFKFKPDSDFYYLTGFSEPNSICVIKKEKNKSHFILFVQPRDKEKEIWVGKSAGLEGAKSVYRADEAYPLSEFDNKLFDLVKGADSVYIPFGNKETLDIKITRILGELKRANRKAIKTPQALLDPRDIIHKMRLIKDDHELGLMQEAIDISKQAHLMAMKSVKPGMFEYAIEAMADGEFRKNGGNGPAYTSIVGSGKNATTLHYIDNTRKIQKGDLVLLDAGCEFGNYAADVTRTFPASHKFSEPQREIYELVLKAQLKAIKQVRPGKKFLDSYDEAVSVIVDGLKELKLLKGSKKEIIEKETYKKFFMHKIGHWLGLDVHDSGPYIDDKGNSIKLEPGMVLTIEPGIYIPTNASDVPKRYRGIGVRIEDNVLVTEDGNKVLTSEIPKTIDEITKL